MWFVKIIDFYSYLLRKNHIFVHLNNDADVE